MKSIKENVLNEYIINKSRFICYLIKINNEDDILINLSNFKKQYNDSTHICYAYINNNIKRFSDDKEPSGTAGMPILNVLENNQLNNILCVVIRYFGGVKLGAGGLVRAYTKSVTLALEKAKITDLIEGYKIKISFNYTELKKIDNLLKDYQIISKSFDEEIIYTILISNDEFDNISKLNIVSKEKILINR